MWRYGQDRKCSIRAMQGRHFPLAIAGGASMLPQDVIEIVEGLQIGYGPLAGVSDICFAFHMQFQFVTGRSAARKRL